jgi:Holliday junction resolvasome RuvABC endonuclease subunit
MHYIKKIKIKTVEKRIGKSITRNKIVTGFDTSTHGTGIAIISTSDNYLTLEKLHKINVAASIRKIDAIDSFTEQLDDLKRELISKYKFDKTLIEDCFFKMNTATTKSLARIGILVYDRFKRFSKECYFVTPTTPRGLIGFKKENKKVKGKKLKEALQKYINYVLDTDIEQIDLAEGTIIALAGLVEK